MFSFIYCSIYFILLHMKTIQLLTDRVTCSDVAYNNSSVNMLTHVMMYMLLLLNVMLQFVRYVALDCQVVVRYSLRL